LWGILEIYLTYSGDFAGAEEAMHRAFEVSPNAWMAGFNSGLLLLLEGKPSEALVMYRKSEHEDIRLAGTAMAEHSLGNAKASQQALSELVAKYPIDSFWIALVYGWRGEADKAFEWLERAYQVQNFALVDIKVVPMLKSLRSDPRYKALLQKMNLPE
jgi:tetratricopeptide (TPR) repeat protein